MAMDVLFASGGVRTRRHVSGKTVIVGQTSRKRGEILDLGQLKCIDTYCYGGGWLTALEVYTGEVWQADREGNMRKV
jgi:serine/threonine protein phosphatase 1